MDELEIPVVGDEKWHPVWGWLRVSAVRSWPVTYIEGSTEGGIKVPALLSQLWDEEWGTDSE